MVSSHAMRVVIDSSGLETILLYLDCHDKPSKGP